MSGRAWKERCERWSDPACWCLLQCAVLVIVLILLALAPAALAKNGAFRSTGHGNPDKGPQRRTDIPRGSCAQCHQQHSSYESGSRRNQKALFAANDNELCFSCHAMPSEVGVFPGNAAWQRSTHATANGMLRPDDANRTLDDANKCVNCHDPHGNRDALGVVPALLAMRAPELCLTCHDGSRAANIRNELRKSYRHPMDERGKHDPAEGSDPGRFSGMTLADRHADCADCHNAHQVRGDPAPPSAPQASSRLAGVSRVEVLNGGAGALPNYRFLSASDPGDVLEYQVCFKCHSSFAKLPARQPDLARLTNPENPSFHPIQAEGRNRNIDPAAFTNGWSAQSQVLCTDCHNTDDRRLRGPHGSSYPYILKKPHPTATTRQAPDRGELCFDCHSFDVYADATAPDSVARASRFNGPGTAGHTFHVAIEKVPCAACHESHGSTRNAALIAGGREISLYTQSPAGGTCNTRCHGLETYTASYPR